MRFISTLILLLFMAICGFSQDFKYEELPDGSRVFHEGKLEFKEGVPFLTVKGNMFEVGIQYGVLARDLLVDMDHTVDSLIDSYIGTFFLKRWIANIVLNKKIRKIERSIPEEYLTELEIELEGIVEGSGLRYKDLQIITYFPQLFFDISCTSFIMKNETGLVHGRNLDWPGIGVLSDHAMIVNYYKQHTNPITVLTYVGYPGVYTGMNHSGLSMSINMNGTPAENNKEISDYNTCMPLALKLRHILENADDLNGVDKEFKDYSSHAWFITVGSKKDNSGAIYELTRGEIIKNEMKDDFLFVENLSLSDKGRYMYSPIWMFGASNISREKKIKELYQRIDNSDLVSKSYQILTSTENHHLSHDPFYRYSINNSNTVISCIMDNINNDVYFTYDKDLSALNKYLKYDIETGSVSVYKEKQEVADKEYRKSQVEYNDWYSKNYGNKKKLESEDYNKVIQKVNDLSLEPAYKAYLLSHYYSKLGNHEKAFENAEKYIAERPDYYHSYYNKYLRMKEKGDYMGAIVALEEMMQTSTFTPYYNYFAKVNMIELYDKIQQQNPDNTIVDKIYRLADEIRDDLKQYFIDAETQKDLNRINAIEEKYRQK